jgi:glycosyltransferase involved in cell wall biosynthesis
MIETAGAGIIVEPFQPKALAAAIKLLSSDRARATSLGNAARHYAEQYLSLDVVLPQYAQLFERLLTDRSA